jgi:hypothetical protein
MINEMDERLLAKTLVLFYVLTESIAYILGGPYFYTIIVYTVASCFLSRDYSINRSYVPNIYIFLAILLWFGFTYISPLGCGVISSKFISLAVFLFVILFIKIPRLDKIDVDKTIKFTMFLFVIFLPIQFLYLNYFDISTSWPTYKLAGFYSEPSHAILIYSLFISYVLLRNPQDRVTITFLLIMFIFVYSTNLLIYCLILFVILLLKNILKELIICLYLLMLLLLKTEKF